MGSSFKLLSSYREKFSLKTSTMSLSAEGMEQPNILFSAQIPNKISIKKIKLYVDLPQCLLNTDQ